MGAPSASAASCEGTFGNIPTVSLCTDDIICDEAAASGWIGYAQHKHTENYNFNVDVYSDNGVGQWFNGQYFPDK